MHHYVPTEDKSICKTRKIAGHSHTHPHTYIDSHAQTHTQTTARIEKFTFGLQIRTRAQNCMADGKYIISQINDKQSLDFIVEMLENIAE